MNAFTIRRATATDAEALARFAAYVFDQTFRADNRADDMEEYLRLTYAPDIQRAEIEDEESEIFLVEAGSALAGYAYLLAGAAPDCVAGARPVEIKRFYVDRLHHGAGLASALMDESLASAAARGDQVWLSAWEHNGRAMSFYRRHGFEVVGERPFRVGSDVQRDLLMARSL